MAANSLNQIKNSGDLFINELVDLSDDLISNTLLVNLCKEGSSDKKITEAVQLLMKKREYYPVVRNVYMILPQQNACYSMAGKENLGSVMNLLLPKSQTFVSSFETFNTPFEFVRLLSDTSDQDTSSLAFLRAMVDENAKKIGVLMFCLDKSVVNIRSGVYILPDEYDVCWVDDSDEMVFTTVYDIANLSLQYKTLNSTVSQKLPSRKGKPPIVCYAEKSDHAEMSYAILAENPRNIETGLIIYLPMVLNFLIVLSVVFVLFYKYVYGHSKTINQAFQALSYNGIISVDECEEGSIDKLVVKLVAEREILSEKLTRYKTLSIDTQLSKLLACEEVLNSELILGFPYAHFCVISLSITNQSLFRKDTSINASEEKALIKLVVDNILNEHYRCYSRYNGKKITCVYNFHEQNGETAEETVRKEMGLLQHICQDELELICIFGISSVVDTMTMIGELCKESYSALEYAMIKSRGMVLYDEVKRKNPEVEKNYYRRLIEKEHIIVDSCNPWIYKNISVVVMEFVRLLIDSPNGTFENVKIKSIEVMHAIVNSLRQNYSLDIYSPESQDRDLEELRSCNTGEQIRVFFQLFLKKMNEVVTQSKVEEQDYFIANVESLLDQYYSDKSLSVGMIANELNLPMRVVSSMYKTKTGYGLLDRIHSFRLEKAKKALLETQYSIYEIADNVGYENVNTFIRVFKKYTGTTPGQFRDHVS